MNSERIRVQVAKAIDKMPTEIRLMRYERMDDGMGGYVEYEMQSPAGGIGGTEPEEIAIFNGLLDNSKHSYSQKLVDGGIIDTRARITLLAVYSDTYEIKNGDFFTVKGTTYKVKDAVNILNMDIYWECNLEVDING